MKIKSSIIKAKIKRSGINFRDTFLWDNCNIDYDEKSINFFLASDEEIIVYYIRENNYRWILSNRRLFIPSEVVTINLEEIVKIDFKNLKDNPDQKLSNTELNILTKDANYKLFFEEGTWHLFYEIFKHISSTPKKTAH